MVATPTAMPAATSSVPTKGLRNCPRICITTEGFGGGRQGVGAKLLAQPLHLLAGEASIEVRAAFAHDVFDRHRVP